MDAEEHVYSSSFDNMLSDFLKKCKHLMELGIDDNEEKWLQHPQSLHEFAVNKNVVIFLWNANKKGFAFMSDRSQILGGYSPASYTQEMEWHFRFPSSIRTLWSQ